MSTGEATRLVLHHEHRLELSAQVRVHHHLHRDAAVDQQGGAHARRDRKHVLGLHRRIHVGPVDVPEGPCARVAGIDRDRLRPLRALGHEEGVAVEPRLRLWRHHVGPPHRSVALVSPPVRSANRHDPVVAGYQPHRGLRGVTDRLTLQHVERLLERMEMQIEAATWLQNVDPKARVNRGTCVIDHRPSGVPGALRCECLRHGCIHLIGIEHDVAFRHGVLPAFSADGARALQAFECHHAANLPERCRGGVDVWKLSW